MPERLFKENQLAQIQEELLRRERGKGTIEKYLRDLRGFCAFLGGRPLTKELCLAWKDSLLEKGLAARTVNSMLSALNAALRFLGWEDLRLSHLRIQQKPFREEEREMSRGDYARLVQCALTEGKDRLALLMETLASTGIRVSELPYITVEAAKRGRADIALKGKVRSILLPGKLRKKLLAYAREKKIASGKIFLTKRGNPLTRGQIWAEMKALCKTCGVDPRKVFPHNFRHLFAVIFYQAHHDIARLADILGHSSINTTRIYLVTTGREHLRQLEQMGLVL